MESILREPPLSIFRSELAKYGIKNISSEEEDAVIAIMRKQVVARFMYDYRAVFDYDTGDLAFMVSYDDYEKQEPWILKAHKGRVGGLHHDDEGEPLSVIVNKCEHICRDYIRIALSYSASGVAHHVKEN
jgi:hypothetical protein